MNNFTISKNKYNLCVILELINKSTLGILGKMENLKFFQDETKLIIQNLLEDGSNPSAIYTIEYHFSSQNFNDLVAIAENLFKEGYEVLEIEELNDESSHQKIFAFDLIIESELKESIINNHVIYFYEMCKAKNIEFDGWGTYFEDIQEDEEY